jgi:ADP-heptose:LPS heptosyltransferase
MEKILLCRTDGIGDLLLVTPLIKEVKRNNKFVAVLASYNSKDVLVNNPDVDKIFVNPSKNLRKEINSYGFDKAYIIYPRFSVALLIASARIPERIGTAYRWYSFLFNKKIRIHRKYNEMHEADYNMKLAEDITGAKKAERLYFYLKDEELKFAKNYLEKKGIKDNFFIVYPCGAGSAINLPLVKYAELIDMIHLTLPDINILIASGKNEQNKVNEIFERIKNRKNIYVMDENLSIRQLAAIINFAKIFISGSTGPMHIAAALNIKTLTFFPDKGVYPVRWRPIGNISEIIIFETNKVNFIDFDNTINKLKILLNREK